jgi:hypothetical protein
MIGKWFKRDKRHLPSQKPRIPWPELPHKTGLLPDDLRALAMWTGAKQFNPLLCASYFQVYRKQLLIGGFSYDPSITRLSASHPVKPYGAKAAPAQRPLWSLASRLLAPISGREEQYPEDQPAA